MRRNTIRQKASAEKVVKDIRRATRGMSRSMLKS